ncbi:unnamed protein product [Musa textilis]
MLCRLPLHRPLEEAAFLHHHLHRQEPQPARHRHQHLPHLNPELLQLHRPIAVAIEPTEQAEVELQELVAARPRFVHAEMGLPHPQAHQLLRHLCVREPAVVVHVEAREPFLHRPVEGAFVLHELANGRPVQHFHAHLRFT